MSLTENLRTVPKEMIENVKKLDLHEGVIFNGMEKLRQHKTPAVPPQYWHCIRDMIMERRDNLAKIFN